MLWLIGQIAIYLVITAVLAGTIGFWVRGWLIADQRTLEHIKWERQLENSEILHQQLVDESSELGNRVEELKKDYQDALDNEKKLYEELDKVRDQLLKASEANRENSTKDKAEDEQPESATEDEVITVTEMAERESNVIVKMDKHRTSKKDKKRGNKSKKSTPFINTDTATENSDNLRRIKGIGPKLERKLNQQGIYLFEQLAQLDDDSIKMLADKLRVYPGRIRNDRWIEQATALLEKNKSA